MIENFPLLDFFQKLRLKYPQYLSMADYFSLMDIIESGILKKLEINLSDVLKLLWLKAGMEERGFEKLYDEVSVLNASRKVTSGNSQELSPADNDQEKLSKNKEISPPEKPPKGGTGHNATSNSSSKEAFYYLDYQNDIIPYEQKVESLSKGNNDKFSFYFPKQSYPISKRNLINSWRSLAIPKKITSNDQMNLDEFSTSEEFAKRGFLTQLKYHPTSQIDSKLILIIDLKGSMRPFENLTKEFVQSASAVFIQNLIVYYTYNFPRKYLFINHLLTDKIELDKVYENYRKNDRPPVVWLSDFGAVHRSFNEARIHQTLTVLDEFSKNANTKIGCLNPIPQDRWYYSSAQEIYEKYPMFHASENGLNQLMPYLKGKARYVS